MTIDKWVDQFIYEGIAFIPVNEAPYGDHIKLLCRNGKAIPIPTNINSFLHAIVTFFGIDMATLRKQYGRAIGRKQLVPFPLSHAFTLVPFKVRRPIGHQATLGWLIAEEILTLSPKSTHETLIKLSSKQSLPVLHNMDWCERQLRNVVLVQHRYRSLHEQIRSNRINEERSVYHRFD